MLAVGILLGLLQAILLGCLAYHYLLVAASIRAPRPCRAAGPPGTRFAVAIPAHDEAGVIGATLAQLSRQLYPRELYDVHVVADHCTDDTAGVSRMAGALVHERRDLPRGRKAYAVRWLLERILADPRQYEAVAVFDADSQVDPEFLGVMDCHLRAGARALQGQHIIANPGDSPFAALAAVDMRLNNRLRNQSRTNLGLACRLMGDAMVLDAGLLRAHGWKGDSIIEDREYGYELLMEGVRVQYVPEARSLGEAAGSWRDAQPQRLRWYRGAATVKRDLARRLASALLRRPSLALLDGLLELLTPGYSWLAAASAVHLAAVAVLEWIAPDARAGFLGLAGSTLLLLAWVAYPVLGLAIDRAPAPAFRALLLGPFYVGWRLWISVLVRIRGARTEWVRTRRRGEGTSDK
ncbi:MAG TPA: glycosyltransferase family 2 protein [Anaerolineae bacterium]|nr:glycosyltransferase family 2 protein [Anaerolineae bacterium]